MIIGEEHGISHNLKSLMSGTKNNLMCGKGRFHEKVWDLWENDDHHMFRKRKSLAKKRPML
jgi:hypothetical protein